MADSAKAQHEFDKANFEEIKAQSKANFEQNKFHNNFAKAKEGAKKSWDDAYKNPAQRSAKIQKEQDNNK